MKRVLFLTGQYGEGHKQAAKALEEVMKSENDEWKTMMIDIGAYTHYYVNKISRTLFIKGVSMFPSVYDFLYQKTRNKNVASLVLKKINLLGIWKVYKLIQQFQPDIVVSTFPFAAGAMSLLKQHHLTDVPTVTVITDYTVHSAWIYPHTDCYLVGSESVKQGLIDYEVEEKRIFVTGIPIHPKFTNEYNKEEIKNKYGLDHTLPVVLFTGGGYGIASRRGSFFSEIEKLPYRIQLVIVCGHNQKLAKKVKEDLAASKHHVIVTGFIDYLDELMAVADVMITKAGGLTVSEAIALQTPLLLYRPLGGQERDNVQFLLHSNMAQLVKKQVDLHMYLEKLLQFHSKNSLLASQQKQAAFKAVTIISNLLVAPHSHAAII